MQAVLRFLRRLGLAVGAWFFVLYAGFFVGELSQGQGFSLFGIWVMAAGATIFAFFIPKVTSFKPKDE